MRRVLPILVSVAAALAGPSTAGAADPAPAPAPSPRSDAAERAAEAALEAELDADEPAPSIQLGPARQGHPVVSFDVGWLRSGLRFDLGIVNALDLVVRLDAMLLYDQLGGQNGISAGLRWTPVVSRRGRVTGEVTAGQLYSPTEAENGSLLVLRGEVAGGLAYGPALAYLRGALRGLRTAPLAGSGFTGDSELGLGVEAHRGRIVGGAEWYLLARPGLDTLSQWRLRLGFAL